MIFEGELEALTKDFKVTVSQPHRSLGNHYVQFHPPSYLQQPQPRPYISQIPKHQFSHSHIPFSQQHSHTSNNVLQQLSNSQTVYSQNSKHNTLNASNKIPPNTEIINTGQANPQQHNKTSQLLTNQ